MVAIPLVGGFYTSRSTTLSAERTVNLYPELDESGTAKNRGALYATPGLKKRWQLFAGTGGIRGLHRDSRSRRVFAVQAAGFFELHADGTATLRGTLGTDQGTVSLASNDTQICLVDGTPDTGYIFTPATNTFAAITDADFFGADTVAYLGSYFLFNRPDTNQFYQSALNDGTTYDANEFSSADASPDLLRAVVSDGQYLWLLGSESAEAWFNSGAPSGVSFDRIDSAILALGVVSPHAATVLGSTLAWLGENGEGDMIFARVEGFSPVRISTHAVEEAWRGYSNLSDTLAYAYQQGGHAFLVWTHPQGTWSYDLTTGLWHERQSFDEHDILGRHRVCCHTRGFDVHLGGDYADGRVYEMDLDTFTDDGATIPRIRRFATLSNGRKFATHRRLEIDAARGVGLVGAGMTGDFVAEDFEAGDFVVDVDIMGSGPQAVLRWSDDHAKTWSQPHPASMGKLGEYDTRLIWRRLGRARDRIYELTITDPVFTGLIGAELEVDV